MSILIALGIGLAFGLVEGFLVAYLDIQPFIVTLAGMFFARGMTTIVHTDPFNVQNKAFVALKDTRVIVPGMGSVNRIGKYVDAYVEIGVIVATADCSPDVRNASLVQACLGILRSRWKQTKCTDAWY